jgi:GntR family transcriptional regulator/MocR family aminotransferase
MPKKESAPDLVLPPKEQGQVLFDWLYSAMRDAIIRGRFAAGTKLPSSRSLASQYQISRGTVVSVYEQLISEGYIESKVGNGTKVSTQLPDTIFLPSNLKAKNKVKKEKLPSKKLGKNARIYSETRLIPPTPVNARAFRTHLPALDLFPMDIWSRISGRRMRRLPKHLLGLGDSQGYLPLRKILADYLKTSRDVNCTSEEIIITSGVHQTLDIVSRVILDSGDAVWHEDPGFIGARNSFHAAQAKIYPIPVDENGMDINAGIKICARPKLIYTTPAHQFPIGCDLSLERRLALIEFARKTGAWIFEDDYDSEFRYNGRPLPSLQGLDHYGSVLYASSFCKVLFLDIRIGYLVVPEEYVDIFVKAKSLSDRFTSTINQAVMCDFIEEGHFGRHLRKMRQVYKLRYEVLRDSINNQLGDIATLETANAGLQTILWLPQKMNDITIAKEARKQGLELLPVSPYYLGKNVKQGLILGFSAVNEKQIRQGVEKLAKLIKSFYVGH